MHTDQTGRSPTRRPRAGDGATPGDPLIGLLLDSRYRIGARVARGGMASVYEATDIRLDRVVAVKVMHAGMGTTATDGDDFAARFVREARAAARLSHPNVVAVYDQGDDDGVVYLAMELVEGRTLREIIAEESPLPPVRALALLEPVLCALAAAHRAGLVHRDVKPENVLIADDGRIKVADFGLAKAVSADTQHTATQGVLIGTVSYLAPELVVRGRADARADVYAAGVVLYELLTGKKPHDGESPIQVAYQHVHADVPPPSRRVPAVPGYLDALVARATARDPAQRPADAAVLLHQLHRVAHALAEGVLEDVELTEDLLPALAGPGPRATGPAPRVYDSSEVGELLDAPGATLGPPAPAEWSTVGPSGPASGAPNGTRTPRRRRRGAALLTLALVTAIAAVGGAYWFGWARYTAAPGVIGLSATKADDRLATAGLELDVSQEVFSETVPRGRVVRTEPAAGSRVLPGGTVAAVVSLGKERYDVPALAGSPVDDAQDALLELALRPDETIERYSEKVPEGEVIRSRPASGTTLRPGSPVDLVVSRGRRPIPVGDWVGKDFDDAAAALDGRGLDAVVGGRTFDDGVPAGAVVSQDPARGSLYRGDTVSFEVSKGPELVEVPGVVAYGVEAATEELEAAGFEVATRNDDSYVGLGFVVGTDPGRGELAPRGSTITLIVV